MPPRLTIKRPFSSNLADRVPAEPAQVHLEQVTPKSARKTVLDAKSKDR